MAESNRMTDLNPWNYLRNGETELGLEIIRTAFVTDKSPSRIMQLGVAYLWSGNYQQAWDHFQHAMVTHHQSMARFYSMAGVAKWCLNVPSQAIEWWKLGADADYADGAGGIHVPLMLWLASVIEPGRVSREEVIQLLGRRADDPRVVHWPGPLAEYVLGRMDSKVLEEASKNKKTGLVPPSQMWLIEFYQRIVELDIGGTKLPEFRKELKRMISLSQPQWSEETNFLHLIWNEEFFIARHEAARS
jgi:hypothetical protein